jgi:hypothetical protein
MTASKICKRKQPEACRRERADSQERNDWFRVNTAQVAERRPSLRFEPVRRTIRLDDRKKDCLGVGD